MDNLLIYNKKYINNCEWDRKAYRGMLLFSMVSEKELAICLKCLEVSAIIIESTSSCDRKSVSDTDSHDLNENKELATKKWQ